MSFNTKVTTEPRKRKRYLASLSEASYTDEIFMC